MAELYWGPTSEFVELAAQNQIAERLRAVHFDYYGWNPPESERRSWRNSLAKLATALRMGGFLDHGIFLEFQVPLTSRRIDALVTGHDHEGNPGSVLIELKQWDDAHPSPVPDCVAVPYYGKLKDVLHPSAQARQYRQHLADTHSAFHDGAVRLAACSYLHDFLHDAQSELLAPRHANLLGVTPLFAGDRIDELVRFIDDRLGGGSGLAVLQTVREGRYRPHKKLLAHTAKMIKGEPTYVLLDEQLVVFNAILGKVHEAVDSGTKACFIVRGGPGTGKSVLAINLLAELSQAGFIAHHATGSSAFTNTVRQIVGGRAAAQFKFFNSYLNADEDMLDILICDEAHRIRDYSWSRFTKRSAVDPDRPQLDELLRAARVTVFFIDDLQAVRKGEIGQSLEIERAAEERGIPVYDHDLPIQFRCGGSDGFVRWVENTLGIRRTANALWSGDEEFEFRIVDSPEELEALMREKSAEGWSARLAAGYCWPWSHPRDDGTLQPDVVVGDWSMPWNARADVKRLAPGVPKSHLWATDPGGIEQVGCIYTAQGFEFDFAGVIFGTDLVYRPREGWVARSEFSYDAARRGTTTDDFRRYVQNTYRVLLSRGLKGCYVYFVDEQTRDFFESRMDSWGRLAAEEPETYDV